MIFQPDHVREAVFATIKKSTDSAAWAKLDDELLNMQRHTPVIAPFVLYRVANMLAAIEDGPVEHWWSKSKALLQSQERWFWEILASSSTTIKNDPVLITPLALALTISAQMRIKFVQFLAEHQPKLIDVRCVFFLCART